MDKPDPQTIKAAVQVQRESMQALFDQLRQDGLDEPGVSRDPYGPGEQRAHATVTKVAHALGLEISHDDAANLYMTLPGRNRSAPVLVFGSHLDSVPHGGNFDGAAGVLAGLATATALRKMGVTPDCDLVVMGIRAEESVWFQVSYIGSRGSLGTLPDGALDVRRVDTGRTLGRPYRRLRRRSARPPRRRPAFRPDPDPCLPGTAHRAGAKLGGSATVRGDLHCHSGQFSLP